MSKFVSFLKKPSTLTGLGLFVVGAVTAFVPAVPVEAVYTVLTVGLGFFVGPETAGAVVKAIKTAKAPKES